jgi:endo-1,4-beta-D-glucanase Y
LAAQRGELETLQKVWDWIKENLTTVELNNKLFGTGNKGKTVWQLAAERAHLETLQKVWDGLKRI